MQNRLIAFFSVLWLLVYPVVVQAQLQLYSPASGATLGNNMPTLTWQQVPCSFYEVWIDGKLMDTVHPPQQAVVPFPLAFGKHRWKVVAVNGTKRISSAEQLFTVEDQPLNPLPEGSFLLRHDWRVQSSAAVPNGGLLVSTVQQPVNGWAHTSVPATVLTALVRNGIYPNPYSGLNNMRIPDASDVYNSEYKLLQYSHLPGQNPWASPYWFRKAFSLPANWPQQRTWLHLDELNYKAEVWLNGKRIADTNTLIGMERSFRLEVTPFLLQTKTNVLAVLIYPPNHPGNPATEPLTPFSDPGTNMADGVIARDYTKWDVLGWDWQPAIRDRDMGITEDVYLSTTSAIEIQDLYVSADLPLPDTTTAAIIISALLVNHSAAVQKGVFKTTISGGAQTVSFDVPFTLQPNESKTIQFSPETISQLQLKHPKLWWPHGYGAQHLYNVRTEARTGSAVATNQTRLGIRKIQTWIGLKERVFAINGRRIFCRGGNWVTDMMLNWTAQRYKDEIALTRNANLNLLRIWGPTGAAPQAFYDAADEQGVLLWQDFLNDFWGTFKNTPGYQPEASLFEQASIGLVKKYRNHPSLIIWCGGNEGPNPRETLLKNILAQYDPRGGRHYLTQSDGDGLHGGGPYHTLEPADYYTHKKLTGFSSEIGPSGLPVVQSFRKFMPQLGKQWQPGFFPIDGVWAYHDANNWPGEDTRKFSSYDHMLRSYYGAPDSSAAGVEQYLERAQLVNYDVYRAAIESVTRQLWKSSSGIVLWKSNSSWPSATWQVYDWYLQAHAGYYATKKAGSMVHVQYNRDDGKVVLVNHTASTKPVTVEAIMFNLSSQPVWTKQVMISLPADTAIVTPLQIAARDTLQFLQLRVSDENKRVWSEQLYWLHGGNVFSSLQQLPEPQLAIQVQKKGAKAYQFTVINKGTSIAFQMQLRLSGRYSAQEALPSLWSDNFFSLLPGQRKTLEVNAASASLDEPLQLEYKTYPMGGWKQVSLQ